MRDAKLGRGFLFECGDLLTEDKLLRIKHMPDGCEQLLMERPVLALEVEHGNGLGGSGFGGGGVGLVLHEAILAAGAGTAWQDKTKGKEAQIVVFPELKR